MGEYDNPLGSAEEEGNVWMFAIPVPGGDRSAVLRIPAVSFIPSRRQARLLFQTVYAGHEVLD